MGELRKRANTIKRSPALLQILASTVIEKWLPRSHAKKRKSPQERKEEVLELARERGKIRPRELKEVHKHFLKELIETGKLTKAKDGRAVYYTVNEERAEKRSDGSSD